MNLLMVTPLSPYPPTSGGRIRQWQELCHLARRHEVTVVFFRDPAAEDGPSPLDDVCRRTVPVPHPRRLSPDDLAVSRSAPWPLRWYGTVGMERALREIHPSTFDAVFVDSLYMTLYRDLFVPQAVLQEHNIESQLARQFITPRADAPPQQGAGGSTFWRAVAMQMEAHENRTWPAFRLRITVSDADKAVIDRRCAVGRTVVVENGADVRAPVVRGELGSRTILFAGALDYFPNVDAVCYLVKAIMPRIWARASDIRLIIAGRHPDRVLPALPVDPRVQLLANPPDMRAVAAQASVAVVPLRLGAGTRVKILESLAWGLPVVSTGLGCAGLALTDGKHLRIRDEPEAFAEAAVELLSDAALWRRLSTAGRAAVERRYGWERLLGRLEVELCRLANSPTPASALSQV